MVGYARTPNATKKSLTNFPRSPILKKETGFKNSAKIKYPTQHDIILFYSTALMDLFLALQCAGLLSGISEGAMFSKWGLGEKYTAQTHPQEAVWSVP